MTEMDLNSGQQAPGPMQSVSNPAVGGQEGGRAPGGFADFTSRGNNNRGAFGGQGFTGSPLMYSEGYPQGGALYLGSYSNPMMASWQFNPNQPNQGIK